MVFGKTYSVSEAAELWGLSEEYVRQMCRQQKKNPSSNTRYRLPEGWSAHPDKDGRWRIFRLEGDEPVRGKGAKLKQKPELVQALTQCQNFSEQSGKIIELSVFCFPNGTWNIKLKTPRSSILESQIVQALTGGLGKS